MMTMIIIIMKLITAKVMILTIKMIVIIKVAKIIIITMK